MKSQLVDGFAGTDGARIFYEVAGSGSPLVLIHENKLDRRLWDAQIDAFAPWHRVIRYDLRGHGRSTLAEGPISLTQDLSALLDTLDVPQAAMVGVGLGAAAAVDYALTYPGAVRSLVLLRPGTVGPLSRAADALPATIPNMGGLIEVMRSFSRVDTGDLDQVLEAAINLLRLLDPGSLPDEGYPEVWEAMRTIMGEHEARANGRHQWVWQGETGTSLRDITVPTLLIGGDSDQRTRQVMNWLEVQLPRARSALVPGNGGWFCREQPERFNHLVLGFLGSVGSTTAPN